MRHDDTYYDTQTVVQVYEGFGNSLHLKTLYEQMMMVLILIFLLQDLQSEIETHRDVYASLTGTGRRLLGSLSSQEDAVMLQRRLDEMNQRWHHLKAKSMAIRCEPFSIESSRTTFKLKVENETHFAGPGINLRSVTTCPLPLSRLSPQLEGVEL
ncbi:hypothetical protein HF086_012403 [Spodoptera exigua]|uniref:Dystrophin n=1 Tax=Spodoptera exigua TaxID=7107 RepID=A0A922MMP5_SPOEX|nr:hypothetical protein HF086_012403 [Spodoptera exigua]